MKVAVVMGGNLGCYRVAMESVLENVIKPNNADVFILASKSNYIHFIKDSSGKNDIASPCDDEDKERIANCFGDALKSFRYTEDIPGYADRMSVEIDKANDRANWINDCGKHIAFYNKGKRKLSNPVRYLDQFLKLHYLMDTVEDYETKTGTQYDYIIRVRIDQTFNVQIIPEVSDGTEQLRWIAMDNWFHGTAKTMKYICRDFVGRIGGYKPDKIHPHGDFRLTIEPQFCTYIKDEIKKVRKVNVVWVRIQMGIKLFNAHSCVCIEGFNEREEDRTKKGLTINQYYDFAEFDTIGHYPNLPLEDGRTMFSYYAFALEKR